MKNPRWEEQPSGAAWDASVDWLEAASQRVKKHCSVLSAKFEHTRMNSQFSITEDCRFRRLTVRVGDLFYTSLPQVYKDMHQGMLSIGLDAKILEETPHHNLLLVDYVAISKDRYYYETFQTFKVMRRNGDKKCLFTKDRAVAEKKIKEDIVKLVTAKLERANSTEDDEDEYVW